MSFDELCADAFALAPPPLLGDFYRDPDDITRGVTLDSAAFDFDGIDDSWSPSLGGPWDSLKLITEASTAKSLTQARRFQEGHEGRVVPSDPHFFLEKTTQYLPNMLATTAGNLVLDFFEQEVTSSITKVNDKKSSIKAEAFHKGLACQMKVYIYQQDSGCAVEFQRRIGDGIAFQGIYGQAAEYLNTHKSPCASQPSAASLGQSISPTEESLAVLVEIARQAPQLQDEIAGSVLDVADEEDLRNLNGWGKQEAFDVLLELLASDRFTAAYPAARLMARLSALPAVRSRFLGQGVLKLVLSRLWVQATGLAVWIQIGNLVHAVVLEHNMCMTSKDRQEAASAIATAIELEPSECDLKATRSFPCAGQQLRETLSLLDSSFPKGQHSSSHELLAYRTC